MTDANVLKVEIENIKKNHDKCEIRSSAENDRLQDQINEQETKHTTTKRGIYDHINKMEKEIKIEIKTVATDVQNTKWSIVKWLFIVMGASAFLQGLVNKLFSLGG